MLRILSTYLIVTKSSPWEKEYKRFRGKGHSAYTKPQTIIFIVLNIITMLFPYALGFLFDLKFKLGIIIIMQFVVGILTTVFMVGMGFRNWFDTEASALQRWGSLETEEN